MKDAYGNYCVQRIIDVATPTQVAAAAAAAAAGGGGGGVSDARTNGRRAH